MTMRTNRRPRFGLGLAAVAATITLGFSGLLTSAVATPVAVEEVSSLLERLVVGRDEVRGGAEEVDVPHAEQPEQQATEQHANGVLLSIIPLTDL